MNTCVYMCVCVCQEHTHVHMYIYIYMVASFFLSVPGGVAKLTFIISPWILHNGRAAQVGFLTRPPPTDKMPTCDVDNLLVQISAPSHSGKVHRWMEGWRCSRFHAWNLRRSAFITHKYCKSRTKRMGWWRIPRLRFKPD